MGRKEENRRECEGEKGKEENGTFLTIIQEIETRIF